MTIGYVCSKCRCTIKAVLKYPFYYTDQIRERLENNPCPVCGKKEKRIARTLAE